MPKGKKKTIKQGKKIKEQRIEEISEKNIKLSVSEQGTVSRLFSKRNIILIILFLLFALIWKFKGFLIVAAVNGQLISRWELTDKLTRRFGEQTLDDVINERLLLAALRQNGIFITPQEINSKIGQIEETLKDSLPLSEALKSQGLTPGEFKRQIEIQLSIDKLFDKEATSSSSEIEEYIRQNSQAYKNATDPISLREEVRAVLRQQKMRNLFDTWFSEIRKNAKINKFL